MNHLHQSRSNSNIIADNSTEKTEQTITPNEKITSTSSLLPLSQNNTVSDAFVSATTTKTNCLSTTKFVFGENSTSPSKEALSEFNSPTEA